jgi:MtN3 and saliva related transmembrane protein
MNNLDLLGLSAGTLTSIAFIPQVIKTWRSRSASDISTRMYTIFTVGVVLWLLYGIELKSMPIVVSNGVTLMLVLCVLGLKYRYRPK